MTGTRADRLPLRGQMIRRLPTKAEIAHRVPIVLTERDQEILFAVYQQGFITTDLIELAFFPPAESARCSYSSRAYERLRQLWLWGYLDRVEQPVARLIGGRRPFLYALGPCAVPLVAARLGDGAAPVQRRRLDRLDDMFIEHDLVATRFWANLKALMNRYGHTDWRWVPERDLRAMRMRVKDPKGRFSLPFLPDGMFIVRYPKGNVQHALVEIDMGTLTLSRFRRKVRGFEAYLSEGLFEQRFGHDIFDVIVVTHSEPRLRNLRKAAAQEVAEERQQYYLFATFDVLDPSKFADDVWLDLDGDYVNVRSGMLASEEVDDQVGE